MLLSVIKLCYVLRYSQKEQIQYTLDEKGNINTTKAASVRHSFTVCYLFIVCVVYLSQSTLLPFSHHPLTLHQLPLFSFHSTFLSIIYSPSFHLSSSKMGNSSSTSLGSFL